jgi:hypothetical protein
MGLSLYERDTLDVGSDTAKSSSRPAGVRFQFFVAVEAAIQTALGKLIGNH